MKKRHHIASYRRHFFRWYCIWILLAGFLYPLNAWAQCPDGPSGITGYWSLDGNQPYEDNVVASGAQSGFCDGGSAGCPSRTSGGVISAAQIFNGSNDGLYIQAQSTFDWPSGEGFAVEVWVKRSASGMTGEEVLVARKDADSGMEWRLSLVDGASAVQARFSLIDNAGASQQLTGSKEVANDTWHHVALVYDAVSGTLTLFVDGVLDASAAATFSAGLTSSTARLTMGYVDDSSTPLRFGGTLDEVAVYNEALEDREVAGHYYLARNYCEMFDEDIKVMPLGDSITMDSVPASGTNNGYRKPLWSSLFEDMVWTDFVGRLYSGDGEDGPRVDYTTGAYIPDPPDPYPSDPSFDIDHEGHPGIQASEMAESAFMNNLLGASANIDVLLLHIGTNVPNGASADISGFQSILNQIRTARPNATVVVAKIIGTQDASDPINNLFDQYNDLVEDDVLLRINNGHKLILADMTSTGANLIFADFYNDLHPNSAGYAKMAAEWLNHLDTFMPRFKAPVITTTELPPATRGVAYTASVAATGRPRPDFVLGTAPSGMSIDADGQLTWTPPGNAPAQETVEVTAVLPGGNSDWANRSDTTTFALALNSQPTAADDAYGPIPGLIAYTVSAAEGVLANDDDPDSGDRANLTAELVDGPDNGTLTLNTDGSFSYTYTSSSGTTDSFTYSASDGKALSAPATVTFNVQPALSTNEETPITIGLADFAHLPAGTTAIAVDPGANYTVSGTTVTPAIDFDDVLTVGIRFLAGGTQVGSFDLSINVVGINDAPEILGQGDIRTPVDTPVSISISNLTIDDPDNSSQDLSLNLSSGANYTLSGTTVTPASGFNGNLSVPAVVSDGELSSAPFNLTITVGSGGSSGGGGGGGGCFIDVSDSTQPNFSGSALLGLAALLLSAVWPKGNGTGS